MSINNLNFANWIPLIYTTKQLEMKETTETVYSAIFCNIYLIFATSCQLSIIFYDKIDYFNVAIIHFSYLDNNMPIAPVYGVMMELAVCIYTFYIVTVF